MVSVPMQAFPVFRRSSSSVYYTKRKHKNKKRGRPGNEDTDSYLWTSLLIIIKPLPRDLYNVAIIYSKMSIHSIYFVHLFPHTMHTHILSLTYAILWLQPPKATAGTTPQMLWLSCHPCHDNASSGDYSGSRAGGRAGSWAQLRLYSLQGYQNW